MLKKMHSEKCSKIIWKKLFNELKKGHLMFYNIMLTRCFNIANYYHMTFKNCLKMFCVCWEMAQHSHST